MQCADARAVHNGSDLDRASHITHPALSSQAMQVAAQFLESLRVDDALVAQCMLAGRPAGRLVAAKRPITAMVAADSRRHFVWFDAFRAVPMHSLSAWLPKPAGLRLSSATALRVRP